MNITENASNAILSAMQKTGLDPSLYHLYFCDHGEGMAFNFVKDEIGKRLEFNGLKVIVALDVDTEGLTIDLREVDGRAGLIFTGEEISEKP